MRFLRILTFNFISILTIIFIAEIIVRILFPDLNCWNIDKNIFDNNKFYSSYGFKSGISGKIYGKSFITDELGFRGFKNVDSAKKLRKILILGDSITFGAGVEMGETFSSLLENKLSEFNIYNASIPGYWIKDYYNILNYFLKNEIAFEGVVIILSLNDFTDISQSYVKKYFGDKELQKELSLNYLNQFFIAVNNKIFDFNTPLIRFSKAYILIRNILFDTSKALFYAENTLYDDSIKEVIKNWMTKIDILAKRNNKWIIFVVVPYEFQLRAEKNDAAYCLKPQNLINDVADMNNLLVIDLYPSLKNKIKELNLKSNSFYLTFDPMHLSKLGHQAVSDAIYKQLQEKK
jgi:lysophospholipase L1-like esterase